MSKTYKHQHKQAYKNYWKNRPKGFSIIEIGGESCFYRHPPEKKDINEPQENWAGWGIEAEHAKYCRKDSNRQCRRNVKSLVRRGLYTEALHLKPRNVDWEIW